VSEYVVVAVAAAFIEHLWLHEREKNDDPHTKKSRKWK
jgi:hypothetical protein